MIPVSQNEKLVYKDPESQVEFFFKSLTGENELEYAKILERYKTGMPKEEEVKVINDLTDFFLIGWDNAPTQFPDNGKPSAFFMLKDKERLFNIAMKLNGIESAEQKN